MDPLESVPSPEALTALSQARTQAEVSIRIQKMAMDAGASQAAELLKSLGLGANLDTSA